MSGKPAARLTDPTSCPVPGHGTPPIQSGSPDVQFNNLPAARKDDAAACGQQITGAYSATVFINGKNAAVLGSTLSHGGVIIGGSGDVLIGDTVIFAPTQVVPSNSESKWIRFKLPALERYAGMPCIAHFEDGSKCSGVFDKNNAVEFINPSGTICNRVEIPLSGSSDNNSVTDKLLSLIMG